MNYFSWRLEMQHILTLEKLEDSIGTPSEVSALLAANPRADKMPLTLINTNIDVNIRAQVDTEGKATAQLMWEYLRVQYGRIAEGAAHNLRCELQAFAMSPEDTREEFLNRLAAVLQKFPHCGQNVYETTIRINAVTGLRSTERSVYNAESEDQFCQPNTR